MKVIKKVCVLGAGSWGTTLAILLWENGYQVSLWEYFPDQAEALKQEKENKRFLPGVKIPAEIEVSSDLDSSLQGADLVLFVVPSHTMRTVAKAAASSPYFPRRALVVNASKGLEEGTLERMSQVICRELGLPPDATYSLMGPSHAEEVSRRMPTSVVVAGKPDDEIELVQKVFFRPYFRVYTNDDQVGVELGVSLKNIIAIAAGVCDGLGYGDNTKAALLTRGLVEITRLGCALGARRETFFGLAGIGDLIATCLSRHSRNRYVGQKIGEGKKLEQVLERMVMVAEGVRTTKAAVDLAGKLGMELPIITSVHRVLFHGQDPREAIMELMNRPPQREMRWFQSMPETERG